MNGPSIHFMFDDASRPRMVYRQFEKDNGEKHDGHKHQMDHPTLLIKGSVSVKWKNERGEGVAQFSAPDKFLIRADTEHEITATEDGTIWLCVFLTPNGYEQDLLEFWN